MTTAWFLLAPEAYGGLHLGAVGLSIKTIAVQCVTVNICLWRASRFVPIRLLPIMLHEIWCVLVLAAVAFACRELTLMLGLGGIDSLLRFLISGVVYTLAAVLTACSSPSCWA